MSSLLNLNVSKHADVLSIQVLVSPLLAVAVIVSKELVVNAPESSSSWDKRHGEFVYNSHAGFQFHLVGNERETSDDHSTSEEGATETGFSMNFTELIGITE